MKTSSRLGMMSLIFTPFLAGCPGGAGPVSSTVEIDATVTYGSELLASDLVTLEVQVTGTGDLDGRTLRTDAITGLPRAETGDTCQRASVSFRANARLETVPGANGKLNAVLDGADAMAWTDDLCGFLAGSAESHRLVWTGRPTARVRARIATSAARGAEYCRDYAVNTCADAEDAAGCLSQAAVLCLDKVGSPEAVLVTDWVDAEWRSADRDPEETAPVLRPGDEIPAARPRPVARVEWLSADLSVVGLEIVNPSRDGALPNGNDHRLDLVAGERVFLVQGANPVGTVISVTSDGEYLVGFEHNNSRGVYTREQLARTQGCGVEFCVDDAVIQFARGGSTAVQVKGLAFDGWYIAQVTEGRYLGDYWRLPVSDMARTVGCGDAHCAGDQLLQFARGGATPVRVAAVAPGEIYISTVLEGPYEGNRWLLPSTDLAVMVGCAQGNGNHCVGETGYFNGTAFSTFEVVAITPLQQYLVRWTEGRSNGVYAGPFTEEQLIFGGALSAP